MPATCGTQSAETADPPDRCPICEAERQYVGWEGQSWTTLEGYYGAWFDRVVDRDAKAAVARSAERYARALTG